jgi:hypothetical protein
VPVPADAPRGGSTEIALGAGLGVIIGLAVLVLVFSSGG